MWFYEWTVPYVIYLLSAVYRYIPDRPRVRLNHTGIPTGEAKSHGAQPGTTANSEVLISAVPHNSPPPIKKVIVVYSCGPVTVLVIMVEIEACIPNILYQITTINVLPYYHRYLYRRVRRRLEACSSE